MTDPNTPDDLARVGPPEDEHWTDPHCKHRERHSSHVPYVKRAGWIMVDYRGCARRRR